MRAVARAHSVPMLDETFDKENAHAYKVISILHSQSALHTHILNLEIELAI